MANIPILAAVVSAIVFPVVGTGIYYSVKPSKEETTHQQQERNPRVPDLRPQGPSSQIQNIADEHGIKLPGRIVDVPGTLGTSRDRDNFIKDAQQKRDEALSSIDHSLSTGDLQPFGKTNQTSGYASSYSNSATGLRR